MSVYSNYLATSVDDTFKVFGVVLPERERERERGNTIARTIINISQHIKVRAPSIAGLDRNMSSTDLCVCVYISFSRSLCLSVFVC